MFLLQEWEQEPENTKNMEIAFYSERSIEDELARESSGDVTTILISYVIMFIYVTISLGTVTKWNRVLVREGAGRASPPRSMTGASRFDKFLSRSRARSHWELRVF